MRMLGVKCPGHVYEWLLVATVHILSSSKKGPPEWVVAHDMEFLVSHGRAINSEELKELYVHAAFEQKQEPESAFMKVLTIVITEATFLCIPLSAVLMITSHEWVLLQHECGCYTLLGCCIFFKRNWKSWTVDLGLIFRLWTMTSACSEWHVSISWWQPCLLGHSQQWTCPPTSVSEYEGGMTLVVKQRAPRDFVVCMCVELIWLLLLCVPVFGFYDTELLSYKECIGGVHELL